MDLIDSQTDEVIHSNNPLIANWNLLYHLPEDKNWTVSSYKYIMKDINTLEKIIAISDIIPDNIIRFFMLFVMFEPRQWMSIARARVEIDCQIAAYEYDLATVYNYMYVYFNELDEVFEIGVSDEDYMEELCEGDEWPDTASRFYLYYRGDELRLKKKYVRCRTSTGET